MTDTLLTPEQWNVKLTSARFVLITYGTGKNIARPFCLALPFLPITNFRLVTTAASVLKTKTANFNEGD